MMTLALEPTVQVAAVTAGGTILVTLIGIGAEFLRRQTRAINEMREHTQEARDQVANTHTTNLRDDLDSVMFRIDRVLAGQERHDDALRQQGAEIAGLRSDIAHERRERLAVAERLDDHMASTNA